MSVAIHRTSEMIDVPRATLPRPAAPHAATERRATDVSFSTAFGRAKRNLEGMSQKLVASAFLMPLLSQMRNDPFKSEMFHGGFAEDVFMQQFDTRIADRMAAHSNIPLVNVLTEHFTQWLKNNPAAVDRAADIRIDTLG